MSERLHLLLCTDLDHEACNILEQHAEITRHRPDRDFLRRNIGDYHAVVVDGRTNLTPDVIDSAMRLRVIGCTDTHLDRIDVTAAREYGVEVVRAPAGDSVAIADQVLLLLLQFSEGALTGKTLGLVGFGRTAQQVARRARAFNMRLVTNQPRLTPELALEADIELLDLPDLLRQADFVSLHLSHRSGGTLLGSDELMQLQPHAVLVNLSHPQLVDHEALCDLLQKQQLRAAATVGTPDRQGLPATLHYVKRAAAAAREGSHLALARRIVDILRVKPPSETLSLDIVAIDQVVPHEEFDQKRVDRLKDSLSYEGTLVNPPLVTPWADRYVVLDGATRTTALKQLGYPHIAVQIVPPDGNFTLHTWYHAISCREPLEQLFKKLRAIDGVELESMADDAWSTIFEDQRVLCYFIARDDRKTLVRIDEQQLSDRAASRIRNAVVNAYTEWGQVERTLLTDTGRLLGQFPDMAAVAIFPQFTPEDVFNVARHGQLLPAGLTRFVIPGRVLHLNVPLERLKREEPLAAKRAWLNNYLSDKLARSRVRYYQEPVILIDA